MSGFNQYKNVLLPTTRDDLVVKHVDTFHITVQDGNGDEHTAIDAVSQVGANPLGHRYEPLLEKIRALYREENSDPLMIAGNDYYHPWQKQLAEKFTEIYPGQQTKGDVKSYYCNSGSEAVERGCLKAAQLYKGGNTWMSFNGAFHGRTGLALSLNFSKSAHTERYNFLQRTLPMPFPMQHPERFNKPGDYWKQCLNQIKERVKREGAKNISGLVAEPIQGEGGYIVPPEQFLVHLQEFCNAENIPLVMDEVQSSLRTGHWFASEHFDVEPDMIAVAKAFSGGVEPFGAALIKDKYANTEQGKQSSTFGGNPKECFVALHTIKLIEENNFLENAQIMGDRLATQLEDVYEDFDTVKDHRGAGLMRAIEFQDRNGEPDPETRDAVFETMMKQYGVLAHPCGNDTINPGIRFLLPLNIGKEEIDQIGEAVNAAVADHS